MKRKQRDLITSSLINFVIRVANNESATPEELAALPEIAKILNYRS